MRNFPIVDKTKMATFHFVSTALLWFIVCIFTVKVQYILSEDQFHEELLLKPLQTGHVYGQFKFTTLWNVSLNDDHSCEYVNNKPVEFVYQYDHWHCTAGSLSALIHNCQLR